MPFAWKNADVNAQNVVVVFQGTDIGAGVIVVGAHYDSISTDFTNGQAYAPGANDNGSGVAALLEVARILAPQPHRATVVLSHSPLRKRAAGQYGLRQILSTGAEPADSCARHDQPGYYWQ